MTAENSAQRPASDIEFEQLIAALSTPEIYPNHVGLVDRIETHASVVFLLGEDVYKLKKPVDFGFLDYSTISQRRRMCEFEVALNARLAPQVYHGVISVTRDNEGLRLGGQGEVIDYLVHMRRLPEAATLAQRAQLDNVDEDEIDAVAQRIGAFHQNAAYGADIDDWGRPAAVRRNVAENFEQTRRYIDQLMPASTFEAIEHFACSYLEDYEDLFNQRVEAGMVRDGHGDLRAEHVYLLDDIMIVDCVEFNERLRCGDVAGDIGFLAMDLDALNRPDLSDRLLDTYRDVAGFDVTPVIDFYRCYRAYVRGKVTAFRLDDAQPSFEGAIRGEARRFFHLAHRYARSRRGPRLILVSGLTGSGKSTLARALATTLPATHLESDVTRKRLAGLAPTARREVGFEEGLYSPAMSERVYSALHDDAHAALARGHTVILDATYIRREDRAAAARCGLGLGAKIVSVHCEAPEAVTRARFKQRSAEAERTSDGRWEIYLAQRESADPVIDGEATHLLRIDTREPLDVQIEAVLSVLET